MNTTRIRVAVRNFFLSAFLLGLFLTVSGCGGYGGGGGNGNAPYITTQPTNQTVTAGQTATFSVGASGTAPLSYQWQKNGSNISGATSSSYTTPATTISDNGSTFKVLVSNSAGSATSSAATLTVNAALGAPSITTQPANQTVTAGQTATFSVVATGTAPLSYQWQKNNTNISGATFSSYTTPTTTTSDSGSTFDVVVSNSAGSITSNSATLTINAAASAPTITTQPSSQTVTAGQTATFSVVATGTAPLSYQWRKNNANIGGATSSSYTTPATTTSDSGSTFDVVVSNSVGSITSNAATLTVNPSSSSAFPIKLSPNKRYFVDQNGTPFLMIADAAHHLMPAVPPSSYAQYINDRVANGFNTINIFAVCADTVAGAGNCPINGGLNNGAGAPPFNTGTDATNYDLSTANPNYWSQVDAFITAAANAGLLVVVEPLPWGSDFGTAMKNSLNTTGCTPDGNPATFTCNNYKFGQFLGNRYKNFPNVVWQFGQDFRGSALPDATFITYQSDVMAGVANTDPNHLITCQMNYLRSYTQQAIAIGDPNFNSTVNVSFLYTYYEMYDYALAAYNDSHVMPVFQGESNYETANNTNQLNDTKYGKGGTAANAFITRQENWYTMTSGGAGTEFGNQHVNHFDTSPTWQSQLDTTATLQVRYLPKLFNQVKWWNLVPDQSHKIVTAGSSGTYNANNENLYLATFATAAWIPDSANTSLASAAIVYTPVSAILSINMGMFSKTMTASWYDPTTGNSTAIPGLFANTGTQNFMTLSGAHSDGTGTNDWVLVLE